MSISETSSVGSSQSYSSQGAGSTRETAKSENQTRTDKAEAPKAAEKPQDRVAISKEAQGVEKADEKGKDLNIAALTGTEKVDPAKDSIDKELFDNAKSKFDPGETLQQKGGEITPSKDGKSAYSVSDMDVCTDGTGEAHKDQHHQSKTSYAPGGKSLNADENPYVVLSPQSAKAAGMQKGDLAAVKYGDKVLPAVFGETGPKNKIGEGAYSLVKDLMGKENINPNYNKIAGPNVETIYFPGSGQGKNWKTEDLTKEKLMPEVEKLLKQMGQ